MRFGLLTALAVAISAATQVAPAYASLQLEIGYSVGTLTSKLLSGVGPVYTYSVDGELYGPSGSQAAFDIDITITTNSPGTPTLAELITVEASVRSNGGGNDNKDLFFRVVDDGFTQPVGNNLTLTSIFAGSLSNQNPETSLTSTALDVNDAVLATVGPHVLGTSGTPVVFNNATTPFQLANLTYIRLEPNATANTTSTTRIGTGDVGPTVPEPVSVMVWSLLIGVGVCVRRSVR